MDPHCTARPGSFQAADTLVDRTHPEVASVHLLPAHLSPQMGPPCWVAGSEHAWKSGELWKALHRCRGHSGPGWLQFSERTSQHCFLGLQVKWEKLISWFGGCALSARHSSDRPHSVLCLTIIFTQVHAWPEARHRNFLRLQGWKLINPRTTNFHAWMCVSSSLSKGAVACCFSALYYPVGGAPAVKSITDNYFVFLEITVTCVEEPGRDVPNLLHFMLESDLAFFFLLAHDYSQDPLQ